MKSVFISILNFNGEKNTFECINSIKKAMLSNFVFTVLAIDNGSFNRLKINGNSVKDINIKLIRNEKNLGFSGGHNIGIKYALENGADCVLILNNDTLVDEKFLEELLNVARTDNSIGILVPKIYFSPGSEFHKDRYKKEDLGKVIWYAGGKMDWENIIGSHRGVDEVDFGQYDKIEETEFASGCCMMVKREVFEKIGLFNEKYFLYYEDNDFSIRAKNANFKISFVPSSKIWHKNAGSAGGSGSKLQDYYITRNRLFFGFSYAKLKTKLALFKESIKILLKGRYWQKRGIIDFYLKKMNKGSFQI